MPLPVCLRLRCIPSCLAQYLGVSNDSDNLSRGLLVEMLGVCYTEPSSENECNFNEINSTQVVNNWKLKSCRECECEDDWTFIRE